MLQSEIVQDPAPVWPLIGLAGPAGSGKSAAAEILAEIGFARLRFAAPLKAAFRGLLSELGVSAERIERMVEGDLKEVPAPELANRTPRFAMQTLGTEWGRDIMDRDFWSRPMGELAAFTVDQGGLALFEDVRFPNEAQAVRAAGGLVVMLTGRGAVISGNHSSEGFEFEPDAVIDNSGSLEDLEAQLLELVLG